MKLSLEEALLEVWRQALVENAKSVRLAGDRFSVRRTAQRGLAQVDFAVNGHEMRGLEQNPATTSRRAQLARSGRKGMQFLSAGRYIAVVVEGQLTSYRDRTRMSSLCQEEP